MKASDVHMTAWERRGLSDGETAFARTVFADEIPWGRVCVLQVPHQFGFGAMAPLGKTIIFARWRAWRDFSAAPLGERAWFVHELMHVWQAERGVVLAAAKRGALGKSAYVYKPRDGGRLEDYNIERQAEITRHLFLARAGKPEVGAPPLDWLEEVWENRSVLGRV